MPTYAVTYDIYNPWSGNPDLSGFVVPGLGDVEFPADLYGDAAAQWQAEMGVRVAIDPEDWIPYPEEEPSEQMATCRVAAALILNNKYMEDNGDSWYSDAKQNRRQAIHFRGFTPADLSVIRTLVKLGNAGADL